MYFCLQNCSLNSIRSYYCTLPELPLGKGKIGVLFDDVDFYTDFQDFTVLDNPILKNFNDRMYEIDSKRKLAVFSGANLNSALISDYRISIGSKECKIVEIASSSITCNVSDFAVNTPYEVTVRCLNFTWNPGSLKRVNKPGKLIKFKSKE